MTGLRNTIDIYGNTTTNNTSANPPPTKNKTHYKSEMSEKEAEEKINNLVDRKKFPPAGGKTSLNDHEFCLRCFLNSTSRLSERHQLSLKNIKDISWGDQGDEGIVATIKATDKYGRNIEFFFKSIARNSGDLYPNQKEAIEARFDGGFMNAYHVPETLYFKYKAENVKSGEKYIQCVLSKYAKPENKDKYREVVRITGSKPGLLNVFLGIIGDLSPGISNGKTIGDAHNMKVYQYTTDPDKNTCYVFDNSINHKASGLINSGENIIQTEVDEILSAVREKISKNFESERSKSVTDKELAKSIVTSQYAMKKGGLQDNLSKELLKIFEEEYAIRKDIDLRAPDAKEKILKTANKEWNYTKKFKKWARGASVEELKSALKGRPDSDIKRPYQDRTTRSVFSHKTVDAILNSGNVPKDTESLHYTSYNSEMARALKNVAQKELEKREMQNAS